MSTQLEQAGIELIQGFGEEQLKLAPDCWVVGNVATRGMPLIEALLNRGERLVSGPQWLAENILPSHRVLAVAGTHGKTTTSSILAWLLQDAGLEPSFLIGGVPENFGVSARLSSRLQQRSTAKGAGDAHATSADNRPTFVIEADEYDTAFFDKRSKFLHYRAEVAVMNNLEFDHADIFADLEAIERQFHHWVRTLPSDGRLVVNAREEALTRVLARGAWTAIDHFHASQGWALLPSSPTHATSPGADVFEVLHHGRPVGVVQSPLLGEHNRSNVLAAIAAAVALGVPADKACASVAGFAGVKRRMQARGEVRGIEVLDDFAHHPTAIATTVAGLKSRIHGGKPGRILAVIEPRSNTMKLGVMSAKLAGSLVDADLVFAYSGGIDWDLKGALAALGSRAQTHADLDALVAAIAAAARPGDRVLVMSNGGFGGIHERLLKALQASQA
jgi:UDP-N-acetylmuramate: L-alanyl-gamma-D-glutamyl-meso-diaminopimelate ligase